ncbi:MAG: prolipoprotein diacylglyceryl transferase [Planctomycetota bacterium]
MIAYFLCIVAGVVAAGITARLQRDELQTPRALRLPLALAAAGGAVAGAYLLQLPADLAGWVAPPPPGARGDALPYGGRTVLGGILVGWVAVEIVKAKAKIREATGDAFALPLSVALAFGRLGCLLAGCCAGVECAPGTWAIRDASGVSRVPVQAIEIAFHALASLALVVAARRGVGRGHRLATYVAIYAILRFVLEEFRPHPRVLLGLTYYQVLALALFALGSITTARRWRSAEQLRTH